MKKFRLLFLLLPLLINSCGVFKNVDSGRAVVAGASAVTALSISDKQVAELSRQYVHKLDSSSNVAPADNKYAIRLNKIMKKFKNIDNLNVNYKVYLTKEVNAFASGDGSLRVYSGLMDKMTDDEVFAVVGHELGHVKNKDAKDQMKHAYLTVAARYAIGSVSPTAGALSDGVLGEIGQVLSTSAYSRKQEYAADEAAFNYCVANGVDPYAMYDALNVLISISNSSGGSIGAMQHLFSSHPETKKRAERVKNMADKVTGKN
ncbi:MAG: M48 family metalloprotease [Bacteroidales bacterium]